MSSPPEQSKSIRGRLPDGSDLERTLFTEDAQETQPPLEESARIPMECQEKGKKTNAEYKVVFFCGAYK